MKRVVLTIIPVLVYVIICVTGCTKKTEDETIKSGQAGSLSWTLRSDGTLVISGEGEMPDYENPPWFKYRDDITQLIIGNDVSNIGRQAFYGHRNITSVTIGSSVTAIGECAFQSCSGITEIINYQKTPQFISEIMTFGENWGTFGRVPKPNCTVWVPAGSEEAYRSDDGWRMFYKIGIIGDPGSLPAGIGGMENQLKWVLGDDGTLTISGEGQMPSWNIYGTMHSTGTQPDWISYSESIFHVVIEEGVTGISNYAFYGCDNIDTISIPGTVEYFYASTPLSFACINVAAYNPIFSSVDGVLFNKSQTLMILYPSKKQDKSYVIPDGTTGFAGFSNSSGYCGYPFAYCKNLTSLTIPAGFTSTDFYDCTELTEIINHQAIPQANYSVFPGVNKDGCVLYVPAGSEDAYRTTEGWMDFVHIKAIDVD
ncbi:MAG: leucine-rich repeat domain-containing protein [Bacteroidales bacterium]|jgi:hypothetical protein|nr:leucine-rich repeat domain-containing protein [Bacteroidales bacterium]